MEDTPIFWSVVGEFRRAGRQLPTLPFRFVKPKGTIRFLEPTSTGIHPVFSNTYIRTVRCEPNCPMCEYTN